MSDGGVRLWSENRENEDGKQEVGEVLHRKMSDRGERFKKVVNSYFFKRRGKDTDKCLEVGKESGQSGKAIRKPSKIQSCGRIENFISDKEHGVKTRSTSFKLNGILKVIDMAHG
ncbi:hypothetical protein Q3G72_018175 [Acer saccharum]|nr:hypothetical protein Q3G72_018175 [Acer saccharum]